ncbi:MAG TPA: aminoacyl-tRNA deacylase [Treponema sp.]|nr:MAG: aminoacyl-tRNA deacylase [Treponema sp. GWC1_61_84]OHE73714.1 MAG: aminoacyl-tRNA deacylase [Treponema sp. RIFOXYC1_FULL_61_9]HCM27634.1 aminoacyl-tRNA deacylase [Treponema sp.]
MIPEKVRRVLDAHDLSALEFESGSTPTAETAAARIGVEVGQIAKSLLFRGASGRLVMIVCAGDRRVSSGAAKRLAGEKLSMANAEETENATGFRPGGVCPFGVEGVDVYIDESLRDWPVVYPAAGNDATGVPTNYGQLLEITGGRTCAVTAAPLPGM